MDLIVYVVTDKSGVYIATFVERKFAERSFEVSHPHTDEVTFVCMKNIDTNKVYWQACVNGEAAGYIIPGVVSGEVKYLERELGCFTA